MIVSKIVEKAGKFDFCFTASDAGSDPVAGIGSPDRMELKGSEGELLHVEDWQGIRQRKVTRKFGIFEAVLTASPGFLFSSPKNNSPKVL